MFNKLTDFAYQRTNKESFGFYIVYFILLILAIVVMSAILSVVLKIPEADATAFGVQVGVIGSIIFSTVLSFLVISSKGLLKQIKYILLALLAGVIAIILGGFGGLIIPAYITMKPSIKKL